MRNTLLAPCSSSRAQDVEPVDDVERHRRRYVGSPVVELREKFLNSVPSLAEDEPEPDVRESAGGVVLAETVHEPARDLMLSWALVGSTAGKIHALF